MVHSFLTIGARFEGKCHNEILKTPTPLVKKVAKEGI
jgi:hypothetical protein